MAGTTARIEGFSFMWSAPSPLNPRKPATPVRAVIASPVAARFLRGFRDGTERALSLLRQVSAGRQVGCRLVGTRHVGHGGASQGKEQRLGRRVLKAPHPSRRRGS